MDATSCSETFAFRYILFNCDQFGLSRRSRFQFFLVLSTKLLLVQKAAIRRQRKLG